MTEAEWLSGIDAYALSAHIEKGSARKLRLFSAACARHVPAELIDDDCRRLIDASVASAEDLIAPAARRKIEKAVWNLAKQHEDAWRAALHAEDWTNVAYRRYKANSACGMTSQANRGMMRFAANEAVDAAADPEAEKWYQCQLLRDIYGNPFQPIVFESSWGSAEAVELATDIFATWDPANFPRLAKALQHAGCDQAEILKHCRGKGPHVHGCWVIDLILEKK